MRMVGVMLYRYSYLLAMQCREFAHDRVKQREKWTASVSLAIAPEQ